MATTNGETLSELERRAETNRAELAQTVDALHSRVSPGAIKADMRETIATRIRENPLEAMALAVGVAYPLWRLMGRIPAPVLLIGAGLAMARRGQPDNGARLHAASHDGTGGTLASLKDTASSVTSQVTEKAQETIDKVRGFASEKAAAASDFVSEHVQGGREAASGAMDQASETYARTRETLGEMIERHPLAAGGVAFAVGSLLASALPVTRQENRILGEPADTLKRRTQDMASEGLAHARHAAREVYRTAASEIREQGLTPEAARHTARSAIDQAREAIHQTAAGGDGAPPRNPTN